MRHFIFFSVLLFFCSDAASAPKWVKQRPSDTQSYIGIGKASKSDPNYAQTARSKALAEMGAEIKVTISSNSLLRRMETNYQFQEEYVSSVHSSVMQTLEGYDTETWENKKEYWVMVKLNKTKYELRQRQKLDQAKMMASSFFQNARDAADRGEVGTAIVSYFKSIFALKDYLYEDLTHRTAAGSVNYAVDILTDMQKLYRRTHFVAANPVCKFEFSKQSQEQLSLQVMYSADRGDVPVHNLPVLFEFTQGEGILTPQSATDRNGNIQCTVNRLLSKRKLQEVTASLDVLSLLKGEDVNNPVFHHFFTGNDLPKVRFVIELNKPSAFFELDEVVFGNASTGLAFGNLIKADLNENFFTFTNNRTNADYLVKVTIAFRRLEEKIGTGYSVFLVGADLQISVISLSRRANIFSDGFFEVKGMMPGSYDNALRDAREKTLEKFRREILPKLEDVDI